MYDQVFSRLLWKDGCGKANPDLAESWQLAPDNLSITLKLRGGLTWHDGKAVTAQDFVDTCAYLKDPALATDLLDYWFLIGIEDKSDPQFVKKFPVGTGPFKMAE
jgi:ABC-type transport system substrate-binding protein